MKEFDLSTKERGERIHIPFIFEIGKHKLMVNALWDTVSIGQLKSTIENGVLVVVIPG